MQIYICRFISDVSYALVRLHMSMHVCATLYGLYVNVCCMRVLTQMYVVVCLRNAGRCVHMHVHLKLLLGIPGLGLRVQGLGV